MSDQTYTEISIQKISPNKFNPRTENAFKGKDFNELKTSIKNKGVISPILVRPTDDKNFEIVYGERRYSAVISLAIENGNPDPTIPAIVKKMSDDELFDLMTIENVHRKDITPLEEARSYASYLLNRGDKALDDLSVRIGLNPQRIRRRIKVLALPKKILKSWEKGKLLFGHLEQLIRVEDPKIISELYMNIMDQSEEEYTIRMLKNDIDDLAVALKHAKFDIADCLICNKNTDVQTKMFGSVAEKAQCLDMKCFKKKQAAWFKENWSKTNFRKKYKTTGIVFRDDIGWDDFHRLYGTDGMKKYCIDEKCEKFVTIIHATGESYEDQACIDPEEACSSKVNRYSEKDPDAIKDAPSKRDHGQEFREFFYQKELPAKLEKLSLDDEKTYQLMLYSFMQVHGYLDGWFAVKAGLAKMDKEEDGTEVYPNYCWFLNHSKSTLWDEIKKLDRPTIKRFLKAAMIETVMSTHKFQTHDREDIAKHVGTNLKKEWYITPEYLKKKRIKEILEFAAKLKFFEKPTVKKYMNKKFGGDDPTRLKKKELIQVFIESGQNLVGLVPEEIIKQ